MTKEQFEYALTACGCLLKDGKTWYEHNELIKCFEDLGLFEQEPILDKIRAEIEQQERWLMYAGYNAYNVDIAFSSIKLVIDKYKVKSEG